MLDSSTRTKVYVSSAFFTSVSSYNKLIMSNLEVTFKNSAVSNALSTLTLPLTYVQFSELRIVSDIPEQQIEFSSIYTILF